MRKNKIHRIRSLPADCPPVPNDMSGFSLVELVISIVITLVILGVAVTAFTGALGTRESESSRTDALTSAQAAINIMTREISNSGYGMSSNGIVIGANDSGSQRLHIRANTVNSDKVTGSAGEDIT